jgi:diguanylate cyclase (GGDEF)-like protein/PAS domain S-box-containing protein
VTPTIKQRLGLAPLELSVEARRTLLAARAAALSFATLATLVFAAAAVGRELGGPALIATVTAGALAALLVCAYERLPRQANRLIAFAGMAVIAQLTFFQPSGELYAPLYLGIVIYVSFFFSRVQALTHLMLALALWAIALGHVHSVDDAVQIWVLGAGTLAAVAAMTRSMRDRLIRTLERASAHQATLDAFFQHAPAGFGLLDRNLRHERVNHALAEIMGHERHEIEGRTLRELAPINADILVPLAKSVLESGVPVLGIEVENANGDCHLVSYYPVPGPRGTVGVGTAVTDVTHLKSVERTLEETNRRLTVLATTDELTQLPNRRMFGEQLELALARARRGGLAVAILCLDLDGFKTVNDSLGHAYGDRMLVEVAGLLRASARDTDVVARVGGDEFLIMLADLDVQAAPELAATVIERIRDLLSDPIPVDAVEVRIDASVGLAIYPTDSREAAGLLAAADAAMYVGKNALTRVA